MAIQELKLSKVQLTDEAQPRERIDLDVIGEYAEVLKAGQTLPPIVVFGPIVADGFHRHMAHQSAGRKTISAIVTERLLASENVKGFDPDGYAFLAPAIVGRIGRLAKKLKMGREALQATFIEHNRTIEDSLDLPLSPQTCWEKLAQELFKDC